MTAHTLIHEEAQHPPTHHVGGKTLIQLSWPHFWLLSGILGGILALIAFVLFAYRAAF